jgi:HSP20 family protein
LSKKTNNKEIPVKKRIKKTSKKPEQSSGIVPRKTFDLWTGFDQIFEDFRTGFRDLLWPLQPSFEPLFSLPALDVRVPTTDLEDRGKDFLLKAEMPGFTKEDDINIEVTTDSVEIEGTVGWKYDNKTQNYICKERECSTFYRTESLPEEIDVDKVQAKLENGILELILPKKTPKKKKKITIK